MSDIARVLQERVPQIAKRVPRRDLPNWLVRISAIFDPVVKDRLFELGKLRPVSSAKAHSELGWNPRSNDDAIAATAESLMSERIVKA
jgi:dihydroflavonol-4-reductase